VKPRATKTGSDCTPGVRRSSAPDALVGSFGEATDGFWHRWLIQVILHLSGFFTLGRMRMADAILLFCMENII